MKIFEKIGGRKFIFMVIAVVVGLVVDLNSANGLSTNLKDLIIYVGAIYALGNVGSHAAAAYKNKEGGKANEIAELKAAMQQLNENQNIVFENLSTNTTATGEILRRIQGATKE